VPVETTPTDLADEAFTYLEEQVPGWLPFPGNLETWLIESLAQLAGELRDLIVLVPDAIFMYYGETILGLPPYPAVQAVGSTTWTAIDDLGYTVDAGTLVGIEPPADTSAYAFEVLNTFTIPPGTTVVRDVTIRALEAGGAASNITGDVSMLDPLDFIESVMLDGPTSGGQDAESIDAYLARLSALLTLLAPRPILPQDFAVMAQQMVPGVARATAIDLLNLSTGATNEPRCVTVILVDENGQPVPSTTKQQVLSLLQSEREVNFLVFMGDPTYTTIDVDFSATSFPSFDPMEVAGRARDNLTAYLSPANWGVPPFGDTSARSWINDTVVRRLELAQVINDTEGIHYIQTLTLNIAGQPPGIADVTMSGVAPLPNAGSITGSCTPTP
jgi:hypothetical protein